MYRDLEILVKEVSYPCLGAKASAGSGAMLTEEYKGLLDSAPRLADRLRSFVGRWQDISDFATYCAVDTTTRVSSELAFENFLWEVLSRLHACDLDDWDPKYSSESSDPHFKFSFAGRAFYVVGLHPLSARPARRTRYPTLVFNPVWQFEKLRDRHLLDSLIDKIRRRDRNLAGEINPNLKYEGRLSDALQYSGREVDEQWLCPFRYRTSGDASTSTSTPS